MFKFQQYLQHTACDLQLPFNGLITIGVAGKHDGLYFPALAHELFFHSPCSVWLRDDLSFKIEPGTEPPVFMCITGITVNASMLAALVRVHGIHSAQVGTIYLIDNFFR